MDLANLTPTPPAHLGAAQQMLWWLYMMAAVVLPACHVPVILRYLRGRNGIGDGCLRSELLQCCWRVPALLFGLFVVASLPLALAVFLDILGRAGRVLAMQRADRRHRAAHDATALTRAQA